MSLKLYPFQQEDVDQIDRFKGRVLLANEQGTGKTVEVLAWLATNRSVRPAIVVCPASLKWNWAREAQQHVGLNALVLEGTKAPKRLYLPEHVGLVVINYDILHVWVDVLRKLKPKLIAADEAHFVKDRSARRSKALRRLCEGVRHKIMISGTPLTNRPAELFNVLNILRPDLYDSFFDFAWTHCKPHKTPWGWRYDGAEHLDLLHKNLKKQLMIRRLRRDVLSQIPPNQKHVVVVPLDSKSQGEYHHCKNDLVGWLVAHKGVRRTSKIKAEQLVKVNYLLQLAARLKMRAVFEWIDNYLEETSDKLVVFGVHHAVVEQLHERYGKTSLLVYGKTPPNKRKDAQHVFNTSKTVRLFIGNVQAAGVGLSLKAPTTAVVELPWTPGELSQAIARTTGIGRGVEGVRGSTYFLVAKGTIEESLCALLQRKQRILDQTLDGKKTEDGINLHDLLVQKLLKGEA